MKEVPGPSTVRATVTFRRYLPTILALLTASLCAAVALSTGCADQGEGERCDTRASRNGSDDCQPGLVCTPFSDLGSGANVCEGLSTCGVCCPSDRSLSTTDTCALSSGLGSADAAAPADSGADANTGTGTTDAGDAGDASSTDAASTDAASSTDGGDAGIADASDSG